MANDELDSVLGLRIVYDCCCVRCVDFARVGNGVFFGANIQKSMKYIMYEQKKKTYHSPSQRGRRGGRNVKNYFLHNFMREVSFIGVILEI